MKKIISLIMALALVFSMSVFAQEAVSVSEDAYSDAKMLSALSIIPGASASDEAITRGEFAYYLVHLTKAPAADYSMKFADVGAQHKYFKEIMQITGTKAMVGKSEFLFYPDDTLTVSEAAKTFVCLLGYGDVALYEGGYPSGYLAVAQRIGLLKGISGSTLTKSCAQKMVVNSLEIPWAEKETYGNVPSAIIQSKNTFLRTNFNIYKLKNKLVLANEYSSLTSTTGCTKDAIVVDNMVLFNASAMGDIPLGASVDAYYTEENGKNVLKFIALSKVCNILEISKDDVSSFSMNEIKYYSDNYEVSVKVSGVADFIYNGVFADITQLTADDKNNCSLTLVDADNNGEYETIHINIYDVYYLENVYYDNYSIKDYNTEKRVTFDPQKSDIVVYNGSSAADFDSLQPDKLVSVTTSKNDSLIKIFVSNETAGGLVSETDANGFTLEGKYYKASSAIIKNGKMPSSGDMGTIYIDKNGEAGVFISKISGAMEFGYLIDGAKDGQGLSQNFKLKILNSVGEINIYNVADRLKIDGKSVSKEDANALQNLYRDHLDGGSVKDRVIPQLISYSVNSEDEIIEIDTEYMDSEYEDKYTLFSKSGKMDRKYSIEQYSGLYGAKIYLDMSGLTVFNVPNNYDVLEDKKFSVSNYSTLYANYGNSLQLKAYNEDDVNRTKLAVNYIEAGGAGVSVPERSNLFLVDYVASYQNEDGELGAKIYGLYNEQYSGYPIDSEVYNASLPAGRRSLKRGDVIQVALDAFGEIIGYTVCYDIDKRLDFETGLPYNNNWQTEHAFFNGTVHTAIDDHFVLQYGWKETYSDSFFANKDYYTCKINWGGFYIFDEEKDEVRMATVGDIKSYKDYGNEASRIFARFDWGTCTSTIIFKFKSN